MRDLYTDWLLLAVLVTLASLLCGLPGTLAQDESKMEWISASNSTALCNDFTRAGFFIRQNMSSNNWVVFLESGGLCFNPESCNRRFFTRKIREEFRDDSIPDVIPYGSFDPSIVWNRTIVSGRDPANVISPLMTSMKCFENVTEYFPNGLNSSIEGRDILDPDPTKNRLFHSYNHVVIPYCSSDVWLGGETTNTEAVGMGTSQCDCFNYTTSSNQNGCFNFNPNSPNVQFTFRGKIIYQSIIQQLLADYGMDNADKVILAGSSAGGLGVINHANWTRETLDSNTKLMVFVDSAWFVDFQNGIGEIFNGVSISGRSAVTNNQRLFQLLMSNSACNDTDRLGYPCCISAHCVMTQRNSDGELQYYPKDTPTFALFSIYDIYLLAPGLARVASIESAQDTANTGDGNSVVLNVLRIVGEYGGIMNSTLDLVTTQAPFLSYYVTQCFQHIYLATSTLWGADDQSVFGSDSLEFTRGSTSFRHLISSDRWNRLFLAANEPGVPFTILEALTSWMALNDSTSVQYTDVCQGVLCNSQCPDDLRLGELTSNNWHTGIKITIAVLINAVAVFCVISKLIFRLWLYRLEKKQLDYLHSLDEELEVTDSATLPFPYCDEKSAISVSCLDLCYAVKFKDTKALKDERKDQTAPVVLHNLDEDASDLESENDEQYLASTKPRSSSRINLASAIRHLSSASLPDPNKLERKLNKQKSFDAESKLFALTRRQTTRDLEVGKMTKLDGRITKNILKGVSVYFNPGRMVAIMGPSGCGKTTFLDLLTGRRKSGIIKGAIYVNGTPIDDIREWYTSNTGYVLQLATPYYEELTVRENLILAAQLILSKGYTLRAKFERVEQVMQVTGLSKLSETVVGGSTGSGLSGGQKKRLVVALQLLNLPSIIFLDEPTSGLDATASYEILTHLNKLADSNRTVVLTIHQPRLEIFHMFHQLVLLSDGKVAYHDVPDKAYEVFLGAVTTKYLEQGLVIPSLVEAHNPADVIMDMLGNPKMRHIITENYQRSREPMQVRRAIITARWKEYSVASVESLSEALHHIVYGAKHTGEQSSLFTRMAVLEARAAKRFKLQEVAFFPFMFFLFGFVLGTSYFQVERSLLIISGMCVFSTASALFMFPAMHPYYQKALVVYGFEKRDGVGNAYDLVIQGFIRFTSITFFPVIFAVTVIYLLLVNHSSYHLLTYLQVLLVNIALNQTWIALLIALICAVPTTAFRFSQVISATAGFSSGFFIPIGLIHWGYRWIVYINPNYYGLSSVAFFVLSEFETDCTGNQLECYITSGPYVLNQFFFDKVNPYFHLAILLSFTVFYLLLAIFANWIRHTVILSRLKRIGVLFQKSSDGLFKEFNAHHAEYEKHFSCEDQEPEEDTRYQQPLSTLTEEEETESCNDDTAPAIRRQDALEDSLPREQGGIREEAGLGEATVTTKTNRARGLWRTAANRTIRESNEQATNQPTSLPGPNSRQKQPSGCSCEGDNYHQVWRPKKQPRLADLVASLGNLQERQKQSQGAKLPPLSPTTPTSSLRSRQQMLQDRIQVTQAVLTDEILSEERAKKPKMSFKEASKRITMNLQKQQREKEGCKNLSDVVSLYLAKMRAEGNAASPDKGTKAAPVPRTYQTHHGRAKLHKRRSTRGTFNGGMLGAIPLDKWHKLVWDSKTSFTTFDGGYKLETEL